MDRATVCLRYRSFNPKRLKPPARLFADARRPTTAPKPMVDIKHIRQNLELYERTCIERNYKRQAVHAGKISQLHGRWQELQRQGRSMRERSNLLRKLIANPDTSHDGDEPGEMRNMTREQALEEARRIKDNLAGIEKGEAETVAEMEALALEMPNLTDEATPRGAEPALLRYINEPPKGFEEEPKSKVWRSHIHIGTELGLLDLAAAAKASGWGWYYLLGEAAQLEQALVQYALAVARRRGWTQVSPPSLVYSHIGAACGFQPRDQHGEQQIYTIAQSRVDADRGVPQRCLAGTSEIALAGMEANATLDAEALPLRRVAVSRCFRAEAGARGIDTKGLYRVHEFTKVELFAWTAPDLDCARALLDDMVDMQVEILAGLGLYCRVLAMPVADLGASATHKIDIEAYFPSRRHLHGGWGELTSASLCTDYQTRRLATRTRIAGRLVFPYSANATGLAVPRVLAALFEYGWNEVSATVAVPPCLRLWMDGKTSIGSRNKSALSSSPSPALGSST